MLEAYWPQAAEVNACIKNEAETADVAVLLAVHQPVPLVARAAVSNRETVVSEKQLLDAFLSEDVPGGYLLCPITGPSGVGKSHVIRWLDAQLQRSKKHYDLLIIRIPKSASLRKVVELILAPLADNPRYARPREELSKAVAEVDPAQVTARFAAELRNALLERAKEMRAQVAEGSGSGADLRALIGHAEQLPKLFQDAVLYDHFAEHVFSRIIARALQGRDTESEGDETDTQFSGDDLLLPETVDIQSAALPVRNYFMSVINVADPARREPIAKLLNSVVDRAIGHVFRLEQSSGGLTLQDIILGVRETLLDEGKELVLLVEDFAALAGIQEALLNVCIQEGVREGKKVYATMRTALALTDGYLTSRETILTRAQRVWTIGKAQQSEAEISAAAVEMVGAYLNAARWGEEGLKARFRPDKTRGSITDWLPVWADESRTEIEDAHLDAFGKSAAGHPLFPFNREAVERLVAHHLVEGGRLTFNPRRVINEILRNSLLDRGLYVRGEFPPAGYHGLRPNGYLAGLVGQSTNADPIKRRLQSALAIWAGDASDARALSEIPPAVFETFGLPTPQELTRLKFRKKDDEPPSGPGKGVSKGNDENLPPEPEPEATQDRRITEWVGKLDRWADGETLPQADSRTLRNLIAEQLQKSLNYAGLRLPDPDLKATSLWIAGAASNPNTGRILRVCEAQSDDDGAVRAGLLGMLRFDHHKNGWDYPEGDDDYVASTAIVEKLRAQLEPLLVAEAKVDCYHIGQALTTQARLAGMEPPVRVAIAPAVLGGLFDKPPSPELGVEPNWDQLRQAAMQNAQGRDMRTLLQESLLSRTASFQGDQGRKPFAIDTSRLFDGLTLPVESRTSIPETVGEDIKMFLPLVSEDRIWTRIQGVLSLLRNFREEVSEFLDEAKLDKAAFVDDLKAIVALLVRTQCWPGQANIDAQAFARNLTEFQTSPYGDLAKAAEIVDEAGREQLPKLLNAIGALDLGLIQRTLSFLQTADDLVTQSAPRVAKQEEVRRQSDPMIVADEIVTMFDRIDPRATTSEVVA